MPDPNRVNIRSNNSSLSIAAVLSRWGLRRRIWGWKHSADGVLRRLHGWHPRCWVDLFWWRCWQSLCSSVRERVCLRPLGMPMDDARWT